MTLLPVVSGSTTLCTLMIAWRAPVRSWAGDSGAGRQQDMWVPYEPHVCLRLETARQQGEQIIELDPTNPGVRHIDLTDPANIKQR